MAEGACLPGSDRRPRVGGLGGPVAGLAAVAKLAPRVGESAFLLCAPRKMTLLKFSSAAMLERAAIVSRRAFRLRSRCQGGTRM